MRLAQDRSIKWKLTLLMIMASGAALLVASAALVANHYAALRTSKATELVALADVLASNSTAAMSFHQKAAADELLASLSNRPTVEYACLFDDRGDVFASYRRGDRGKQAPAPPDWTGYQFQEDERLTVALPVAEDGEMLGTIYIRATTDDLYSQFYQDVTITLAVIAMSLIVVVLISARLQRVISQPILTLAATAQQVGEQGDYSVRVEPRSNDEIGSLYRQFNRMLQRIQAGEEELHRLTSILEATSDLVSTATPDGHVTYINRAGRRLLGLADDKDLAGVTVADLHPEWALRVVHSVGIPAAVAVGSWQGETAIRGPDDKEIPVSQVITCHKSSRGEVEYLSTIIRDVSERKQAENEREKLIVELESKNAELERFAYTVSHDLKAPLITIKGYVGLLQRDLADDEVGSVEDDLGRIAGATDRMHLLLGQVLELSRIGRVTNPPEEVELAEVVKEALRLTDGAVSKRQVDVRVAPDLPLLYGDKVRLVEVLQNLIENAVKYTGEQLKPRIEIGARLDGDQTVCFVRDNGIGIEPQYREKIFGLFDQLDQSVEGSGVGLALVKRIIEVHRGRIWVESAGLGKGSTFCFALPPKPEEPIPGHPSSGKSASKLSAR